MALPTMSEEELRLQQAQLGVPDPTGGQPMLPVNNAPAPAMGTSVDLNAPPPMAPKPAPLLGQMPLPAAAAPMAAPVEQPIVPLPQTVSQTEERTQIQGGQQLNPALAAEQKKQEAAQLGALAKKTEAEAKADERVAAVEKERAAKQANERDVAENRAELHRLEMAVQQKKQAAAQKDLDEQAPLQEDSSFQRVGKALALALGSFGASLTGGRNGAADVIAADRDAKLTSWKAEYARRKGKVDGASNIYATLRQKGLDDETATAMAAQNLNRAYDSQVAQIMAESKAPATIAGGEALRAKIAADNAQQAQKAYQGTQATVTKVVDERTKTGADVKDQGELLEQANKIPEIKKFKESRDNLRRWTDLRAGGADGAALADFIANTMKQGSYTPSTFNDALKKRGFFDKTYEELRSSFAGGMPPDLMTELGNSLAIAARTSRSGAEPALRSYSVRLRQAGIDPAVLLGGESSNEAATAAGAAPSAYQGKR